jgi:hypothetical protein
VIIAVRQLFAITAVKKALYTSCTKCFSKKQTAYFFGVITVWTPCKTELTPFNTLLARFIEVVPTKPIRFSAQPTPNLTTSIGKKATLPMIPVRLPKTP